MERQRKARASGRSSGSKQARYYRPKPNSAYRTRPRPRPSRPRRRQTHRPSQPPSLPPPESHERQARTTERAQAAAAVPQAEAPDADDPFSQVEQDTLTRLHEIGRKAHGEEQWRRSRP